MKQIIVLGSANTDMVVQCKTLPKPGETVLGGRFTRQQGGKGANQAVAAARLGGDVRLFCRIGKDQFGDENVAHYKKEGIKTDCIIRDNESFSGIALIVVDEKGENQITVAPGANAALCPEDLLLLQKYIAPGDLLLLQLEIPFETVQEAIRIAKTQNAFVILDPAPAPADDSNIINLADVDVLTPNEHEARLINGREQSIEVHARQLFERGVDNVIITCGSHGCYLHNKNEQQWFPAHPVDAVDTTAAGDCFAGALAVKLAKNTRMSQAIEFAQKAAGFSVIRLGAQPSLPTMNDLMQFNA